MANDSNNRFVGRTDELEQLLPPPDASTASREQIKLIYGEAGIGKSSLLTELANLAAADGYQVIWSARIEDPSATPYLTWVLALRSCLASYSDTTLLREDLGSSASLIANLTPELNDQISIPTTRDPSDSTAAKYALFDAVSRFLIAVSHRTPILILMDNLHLADRSSLELLKYFSQQIVGYPINIVAAYRQFELEKDHPLRDAINKLSLGPQFMQLHLQGLEQNKIAPLIKIHSGVHVSKSVVNSIYQQSDGNPLFIVEVAKILNRRHQEGSLNQGELHFEIPQSLQQVIKRRIKSLGRGTAVLNHASILGRDFELTWLRAISDLDAQFLDDTLYLAERLSILEQTGPGLYRFHHALYRETLYANLANSKKIKLHQSAANYLEDQHNTGRENLIELVAHHYFKVAPHGQANKALQYNQKAAIIARKNKAFSEAASFLEQALIAFDHLEETDNENEFQLKIDLQIQLGAVLYRAGRLELAPPPLLAASQMAHRAKNWSLLEKSLAELQYVYGQMGIIDKSCMQMHVDLIDHIPLDDHRRLALAKASLSEAYRLTGNFISSSTTAKEANKLSAKIDNPELRLECLRRSIWNLGTAVNLAPEDAGLGLKTSREMSILAKQYGSTEVLFLAMANGLYNALAQGTTNKYLTTLLMEFRQLLDANFHPHYSVILQGGEICRAIYAGEWRGATKLAVELRQQSDGMGRLGIEGAFGHQMFVINRAQGRLHRYAKLLKFIENSDKAAKLWLPGQILLHCELQNWSRARKLLTKLPPVAQLKHDDLTLFSLIFIGESCLLLNDRKILNDTFNALMRFKEISVSLYPSIVAGAVSGYLAPMAARLGKKAQARKYFEKALEHNESMGALPWLAQVRVDYAQFLLNSSSPKDHTYAHDLMVLARPDAERLNLQPVLEKLDSLTKNSDLGQLTMRELGVLRLVAQGFSNKRIADELSVSLSTVATHVRNILRKLRVSNRTEATDYARRMAIID